MADDKYKYEVMPGMDYVLQESGNRTINMKKLKWGNSENFKIDIRHWQYTEEGEQCRKGVCLNDEGANNLAEALVQEGYGDTKKMYNILRNRDGFEEAINAPDKDEPRMSDYYDPSELLGGN